MVILPSTRTEAAVEFQATPDDPRCMAIAKRYGEADHLFMEVTSTQPKAGTPSLVMVMRTYGREAVIRHLKTRIRIAVLKMDDGMLNDEEVQSLAETLADDKSARILGYDLVMAFFAELESGRYELYACRPRHIIAAWQQYAKQAYIRQSRLIEEEERRLRDAEYERHARECITYQEYLRRQAPA